MQWYERAPELLEVEQEAMSKTFPDFKLDKLEDGRMFWLGEVTPGIYKDESGKERTYTLMAVYHPNHPFQQMGSSVYIYPLLPDSDEITKEMIRKKNVCPRMLRDASNNKYLFIAQSNEVHVGSIVSTAAWAISRAVRWLCIFELVLAGDVSPKVLEGRKYADQITFINGSDNGTEVDKIKHKIKQDGKLYLDKKGHIHSQASIENKICIMIEENKSDRGNAVEQPRTSDYNYDKIEDTKEYKAVIDAVENELEIRFRNTPRQMGFGHIYQYAKKRLLKEKYGIEWKTTFEMNPLIRFE